MAKTTPPRRNSAGSIAERKNKNINKGGNINMNEEESMDEYTKSFSGDIEGIENRKISKPSVVSEEEKIATIDKKGLLELMHKALCIRESKKNRRAKKNPKSMFDSIPLRMEKSGITFAKIETQSMAAFGRFSHRSFKSYDCTNPKDIVIDLRHIKNIQSLLRAGTVSIAEKAGQIHFSVNKDRVTSPKCYGENFNSTRFWENNLVVRTIEKDNGNTVDFAYMYISLKADQFDPSEERHSPLLAFISLKADELKDIPDCESIFITGDRDSVTIGVSLEEDTQFNRILTPTLYRPIFENFKVKVIKFFWELVVSQFTDKHYPISLTISKRYIMFLQTHTEQDALRHTANFLGYMIGTVDDHIYPEDVSEEE